MTEFYDYDSEDTLDEDPLPWDYTYRYLREIKVLPNYRRGILRQTQRYDPFVDAALSSFDCEKREAIKGFTRAPGDDWRLHEKFLRYDKKPVSLPFRDPRFRSAYQQALSTVLQDFKLPDKVVPTWILDVDLVPNTSSGYPHFKKKGSIPDVIRQEGRYHFHHLKLYDLQRCPLLPCTPATRGGLSDRFDPKTRLVWMYPAAMTACEAVFAQPLIDELFKNSKTRDLLLTGVDNKFRLQRYISLISDDDDMFGVGLDFKSFDTLRSPTLVRDAFSVLEQNIAFGYYYDRVTGVQAGRSGVEKRARKAFSNIIEYFLHTPMLLPNGRVVQKSFGVPSGSHFTNIIDSIINRILILTFSLFSDIPISQLRTNGDDSAFLVSSTYVDGILQKASLFFETYFRMTVSVDKSVVASGPSSMHASGTTWSGLRPSRGTLEWLMLAAYSDTYVSSPFESFQRLLGLGIAGAFGDAYFVRFFSYFQTGFDCRHGPNLLNWNKLRWLEKAFNITDLPLVYKQGVKSTLRLRLLVT